MFLFTAKELKQNKGYEKKETNVIAVVPAWMRFNRTARESEAHCRARWHMELSLAEPCSPGTVVIAEVEAKEMATDVIDCMPRTAGTPATVVSKKRVKTNKKFQRQMKNKPSPLWEIVRMRRSTDTVSRDEDCLSGFWYL